MYPAKPIDEQYKTAKSDSDCHAHHDRSSDDVGSILVSRERRQLSDHSTIFQCHHSWPQVFKLFFEAHLNDTDGEYVLVGDECIATKSGKETYGLDHFFSGLLNKVVKGIAIFTLAVVDVNGRCFYPLSVGQVVRSAAEKEAAPEKKKAKTKKEMFCPPIFTWGWDNVALSHQR